MARVKMMDPPLERKRRSDSYYPALKRPKNIINNNPHTNENYHSPGRNQHHESPNGNRSFNTPYEVKSSSDIRIMGASKDGPPKRPSRTKAPPDDAADLFDTHTYISSTPTPSPNGPPISLRLLDSTPDDVLPKVLFKPGVRFQDLVNQHRHLIEAVVLAKSNYTHAKSMSELAAKQCSRARRFDLQTPDYLSSSEQDKSVVDRELEFAKGELERASTSFKLFENELADQLPQLIRSCVQSSLANHDSLDQLEVRASKSGSGKEAVITPLTTIVSDFELRFDALEKGQRENSDKIDSKNDDVPEAMMQKLSWVTGKVETTEQQHGVKIALLEARLKDTKSEVLSLDDRFSLLEERFNAKLEEQSKALDRRYEEMLETRSQEIKFHYSSVLEQKLTAMESKFFSFRDSVNKSLDELYAAQEKSVQDHKQTSSLRADILTLDANLSSARESGDQELQKKIDSLAEDVDTRHRLLLKEMDAAVTRVLQSNGPSLGVASATDVNAVASDLAGLMSRVSKIEIERDQEPTLQTLSKLQQENEAKFTNIVSMAEDALSRSENAESKLLAIDDIKQSTTTLDDNLKQLDSNIQLIRAQIRVIERGAPFRESMTPGPVTQATSSTSEMYDKLELLVHRKVDEVKTENKVASTETKEMISELQKEVSDLQTKLKKATSEQVSSPASMPALTSSIPTTLPFTRENNGSVVQTVTAGIASPGPQYQLQNKFSVHAQPLSQMHGQIQMHGQMQGQAHGQARYSTTQWPNHVPQVSTPNSTTFGQNTINMQQTASQFNAIHPTTVSANQSPQTVPQTVGLSHAFIQGLQSTMKGFHQNLDSHESSLRDHAGSISHFSKVIAQLRDDADQLKVHINSASNLVQSLNTRMNSFTTEDLYKRITQVAMNELANAPSLLASEVAKQKQHLQLLFKYVSTLSNEMKSIAPPKAAENSVPEMVAGVISSMKNDIERVSARVTEIGRKLDAIPAPSASNHEELAQLRETVVRLERSVGDAHRELTAINKGSLLSQRQAIDAIKANYQTLTGKINHATSTAREFTDKLSNVERQQWALEEQVRRSKFEGAEEQSFRILKLEKQNMQTLPRLDVIPQLGERMDFFEGVQKVFNDILCTHLGMTSMTWDAMAEEFKQAFADADKALPPSSFEPGEVLPPITSSSVSGGTLVWSASSS